MHYKEIEKYWDSKVGEVEFTTKLEIEHFQKLVPMNARILDYGTGYGRTLKQLQDLCYTSLYGIEISEQMINASKLLCPIANIHKYDGKDTKLLDSYFDAVILLGILTCISENQNQLNTIKEIYRIMKPGAYLFVSDFLINNDERNIIRYKGFEDKYKTYGTFELENALTLRHHSKEWIMELFAVFNLISYKESVFKTMNGNYSNGFTLICKK
jgi:SAM-dependent methyltransferase